MERVEDTACTFPVIYPLDNPVFLMDNADDIFEEQIICTYPDKSLDIINHENVNRAEPEEAKKSSSFRDIFTVRVALWPLRDAVVSLLKFITEIIFKISDFVYSLTANEGIRDICVVIASVSIEVFVVAVFGAAAIISSIIVNADGAYKNWSKQGRDRSTLSESTKSKSASKRLKEKPKMLDQKALNYVEEASKEQDVSLSQNTLSSVVSEESRNHPEASFDLSSGKVEDNANKIVSNIVNDIFKPTQIKENFINAEHGNEKGGPSTGTQVMFKNNELTDKRTIKTDALAGPSDAEIEAIKSQLENIISTGVKDPKNASPFESNKKMLKSGSR